MKDYISLLRQALSDPKLEDLACITSDSIRSLQSIAEQLPVGEGISEWRIGLGIIKYEYHLHKQGMAVQLKKALNKRISGGGPHKLTGVYFKKNLQEIIRKRIHILLSLPSPSRSKLECGLLSRIDFDPELNNIHLKKKVLEYMNQGYSLVAWYHLNGIRYSFEEQEIAKATHDSYHKEPPSLPRIVGIRQQEDF